MHFCPQEGDKPDVRPPSAAQTCVLALKYDVRYLDDGDSGFESGWQLIEDFSQKLLVLQDLPHLHDPHDGSLQSHKQRVSQSDLQQLKQREEARIPTSPGWGAFGPPRCSCESSPAPVSAPSSSGRWCSPSASYCSGEQSLSDLNQTSSIVCEPARRRNPSMCQSLCCHSENHHKPELWFSPRCRLYICVSWRPRPN